MIVVVDEQGLEKAWRQLRNRLNDGVPKTNEELKEMASKVITSYIIHKSLPRAREPEGEASHKYM